MKLLVGLCSLSILYASSPATSSLTVSEVFNELLQRSGLEVTDEELSQFLLNFERNLRDPVEPNDLNAVNLERVFKLSRPVVVRSEVERINSKSVSWTAASNSFFSNKSISDARVLMGLLEEPEVLSEADEPLMREEDIPREYNSVAAHPECSGVVDRIRNQGACGSCWAFASTTAFNDRLCIASKGAFKTLLSPQHTTSCCNLLKCLSFGCRGGMPGKAWKWFVRHGVVTGGDKGDTTTCWPYEKDELSPEGTPECRKTCSIETYPVAFKQDIHRAQKAYSIKTSLRIKQQILQHGPVSAGITVYEDFPLYDGGIYEPTTHEPVGGHAVKIVGWGEENGVQFWTVANTWTEDWGEKGYFRIKKGVCGIEDRVTAGTVIWTNENHEERM